MRTESPTVAHYVRSFFDAEERPADFRRWSTLGVALAAVLFLTPFAVNNLVQGRPVLGWAAVLIVGLLAFNAWSILKGRRQPAIPYLGLGPTITFFLWLSIEKQGIIGILWCYPALIAISFIFPERIAWITIAVLASVASYLAFDVVAPELAARVVATLFSVSIFSVIFIRIISQQHEKLERLAATDPLTGLANRAVLAPSLERAVRQSRRRRSGLTVITVDIDNFKAINDTFGHDAGDAVLQGVADVLLQNVRRFDRVFRLGGEEFLVALGATELRDGRAVAEALRFAIESAEVIPGCKVTASLGVATLRPSEDWVALRKRSDENLYRAKSLGRNRVAD